MSLQTIKDAVLSATASIEICDVYQDIQTASDESELLCYAKTLAEWGYSVGILTPELMSVFTPATLELNGIYNSGSFVLNNPEFDKIIVTGTANVEVHLGLDVRLSILLLSNTASLTVYGSGKSMVKILRVRNLSPVTITMNDQSSALCDFSGNGPVTVTANDSSVFHAKTQDKLIMTYVGNNNSTAVIRMQHRSSIDRTLSGAATAIIKNFEESFIHAGV